MDVVRLRTLSYDSILGFGKYYDFAVKDVLAMYKTKYLRWVYFNCDMISFCDDILDEINVYEGFRIEKPGKNPKFNDELNAIIESYMTREHKMANLKRERKLKKKKKAEVEKGNYGIPTKSQLRNKNQGK